MFILKRQDVEIKKVKLPDQEEPILILFYRGQRFKLLGIFPAAQEQKARLLWRNLTDHQGKVCVLLEEPERFSLWGRLQTNSLADPSVSMPVASPRGQNLYIKACLLLLQGLYMDVDDLLGPKQTKRFEADLAKMLADWHFPLGTSPQTFKHLLQLDPLQLQLTQLPPWQEHHLQRLLEEVYRIGRDYFGNADFAGRALDNLADLTDHEQQQVRAWLQDSPSGRSWLSANSRFE
ncbi:MAG: hypothetical protein VKL98_01860 [Cyanobacteriota bacterium]|nr:hypothetical protein [Cyanobacteriota bacterium]